MIKSSFFGKEIQGEFVHTISNPSLRKELPERGLTAAVTIQSRWKGYQTRKKFSFKPFTAIQRPSKDPTYVVGNDPVINNLESYVAAPSEHVALVGTSGLRALSLICKLAPTHTIPKLLIVDNSIQVIQFWRKFRDLVHIAPDNKGEFLHKFEKFLAKNTRVC